MRQPLTESIEHFDVASLCASVEQNGLSQALYCRARGLAKVSDCPSLHRVLLMGAWMFGRTRDALFHFERAELPVFIRVFWFLKLLPTRIISAGFSDWAKFVLWIGLVLLVLGQLKGLLRGENAGLSLDVWCVLAKLWVKIKGLMHETTERWKRPLTTVSGMNVSLTLDHAPASQDHDTNRVEKMRVDVVEPVSAEPPVVSEVPASVATEPATKTASVEEVAIREVVREADAGVQKTVVIHVNEGEARTPVPEIRPSAAVDTRPLTQRAPDEKPKSLPAWRVSKPMTISLGQPLFGNSVRPSEKTETGSPERKKRSLLEIFQTPLWEDDRRA